VIDDIGKARSGKRSGREIGARTARIIDEAPAHANATPSASLPRRAPGGSFGGLDVTAGVVLWHAINSQLIVTNAPSPAAIVKLRMVCGIDC
jgi:hypothetical protein